jgi:hypothetical protein
MTVEIGRQNIVLEIRKPHISFLGIRKREPDIYIGLPGPDLCLQCDWKRYKNHTLALAFIASYHAFKHIIWCKKQKTYNTFKSVFKYVDTYSNDS